MKTKVFLAAILAFAIMSVSVTSYSKDKTTTVESEATNEDVVVETKMTKKQAKAECKKDGLKGKALTNCINEKTKGASLDNN